MAATEQAVRDEPADVEVNEKVRNGSALMALAGVAFIGYGVVFLGLNFVGSGFEIGVSALDGVASADLNPTVAYCISHLHVATAAFVASRESPLSLPAITPTRWAGTNRSDNGRFVRRSNERSLRPSRASPVDVR